MGVCHQMASHLHGEWNFKLKQHAGKYNKVELPSNYSAYLYEKKILCPVCDQTNDVKLIRSSKIKLKQVEPDYRQVYTDSNSGTKISGLGSRRQRNERHNCASWTPLENVQEGLVVVCFFSYYGGITINETEMARDRLIEGNSALTWTQASQAFLVQRTKTF